MYIITFTIDGTKVNILNHISSDVLPTQSSGKTPLTERIYCCSDSNRIYLLFKDSNVKGEKIEKYDIKDPIPMGNTVDVNDWDGVNILINMEGLRQQDSLPLFKIYDR